MMANVRAERLLKTPAEPSPELRITNAAAQTRVVSVAGIRLGPLGIRASFQSSRFLSVRSLLANLIQYFASVLRSFGGKKH